MERVYALYMIIDVVSSISQVVDSYFQRMLTRFANSCLNNIQYDVNSSASISLLQSLKLALSTL